MIGVYDYTVIATYLSLLLGLGGIYAAMHGAVKAAFLCLAFAGLLDAFDGRIARTKKDRTETEKRFGIQIDSLNDLVCFGVLPAAIGCALNDRSIPFLAAMSFYVLAALIRLAYFNVMEEERQDGTSAVRTYYLGMPVTTSCVLALLAYLIPAYCPALNVVPFYGAALFVYGVLFITPIRVRKPKLPGIIAGACIAAAEFYALLHL